MADASPAAPATFTLALDLVDAGGLPVEGAEVDAIENNTVASCCSWPFRGRSDAAGHVAIPSLRADLEHGWRYFVSIRHPDHAEGMLDRPERLPREDGTARARVVLEAGHAVEGVLRGGLAAEGKVLASLEDPRIPGCHSVTRFAAIDAAGRFRITGLHAGPHTLTARAPGAGLVVLPLTVPLAAPLSIDLPESRRVSGRILGAGGAPAAAASVEARWPGDYGYRAVDADAAGTFSLDGLPTGARVEIAAYSASRDGLGFTVLDPGADDVDLTFDARDHGGWTGRIHDGTTGAPIARDVLIRAQPTGTRILFSACCEGGDGRFSLRLPAGEYTLAIEGVREDAEHTALLPASTISARAVREDVQVETAPVFRVPVRVVDAATGAPLAGAAVTGQVPDVWCRFYVGNTGEDGIFALEPAWEGPMVVRAEAEGFTRKTTERLELKRGMEAVEVRLTRG